VVEASYLAPRYVGKETLYLPDGQLCLDPGAFLTYPSPCLIGSKESCGRPSSGYTTEDSGTEARTEKPISWPVQNMGHLLHGTSRALPSQVLKYGFRTISGSTGGVRVEQLATAGRSREAAANADFSHMLKAGLLGTPSGRICKGEV
jgi:hypothetical protein